MKKESWKEKVFSLLKNKIVLVLLLSIPILLCLPGVFRKEQLITQLADPKGNGQIESVRGTLIDGQGYSIDENAGPTGNFVHFHNITLEPGIYRIRLSYGSTGETASTISSTVGSLSFHPLLQNEMNLRKGLGELDYLVWLREPTDSFAFHINYAGTGELQVHNLSVCRTNLGSICILLLLLTVYLICCLYLLWKKRTRESERQKGRTIMGVLAGAVLLTSIPLLVDYCVGTESLGFHMLRIDGVAEALKSGDFPSRIQPEWFYGHGYAVSVFHSDLFLVIPALLLLAGLPAYLAYNTFMLLLNVATAAIAYACFQRILRSSRAGLIGSILYIAAPYRLYILYGKGGVEEALAILFLPAVCLGAWRIFHQKEHACKGWLVLTMGLTGVIHSHIPVFLLTAGFLVVLCLVLWKRLMQRTVLLPLLKAFCATLFLNLWYLVPFAHYFLTEDLALRYTAQGIQAKGLFPAHIFLTWNRAGSNVLYGEKGMMDTIPLTLGAAFLLCVVLYLFRRLQPDFGQEDKESGLAKLSLGFAAAAVLLSLNIFPWDRIFRISGGLGRLVSYMETPAVFLLFADLALSLLGGVMALWYMKWNKGAQGQLIAASLALIALISAGFYTNDVMSSSHQVMRLYSVESLYYTDMPQTDYLPYGTDPGKMAYNHIQTSENVSAQVLDREGLTLSLTCEGGAEEGYVDCALLYYSGYEAKDTATDQKLAMIKGSNGLLRISIPVGYSGTIQVQFVGHPYWTAAKILSAAWAILLVLYGVLYPLIRAKNLKDGAAKTDGDRAKSA